MNSLVRLTSWALLVLLVLLSLGFSLSASATPQTAKQYKCLECHTVDKRVIGPAIREIAKKYQEQPGAQNMLVERIRKNSVGVWGTTPMQGYPDAPQKDLEAIIKWMLER